MNLPCADVAQRALRRATKQDATAAIACVRNLIDVPVVILLRNIFWLGELRSVGGEILVSNAGTKAAITRIGRQPITFVLTSQESYIPAFFY
jgi:hypothetical protein